MSKDGSSVRKGGANEIGITKTLDTFVKYFLQGKYMVKGIRIFGLVVRCDVQVCSSSVDGIFALIERQKDTEYTFARLCVSEIKTQSALGTVDVVYRSALNGN